MTFNERGLIGYYSRLGGKYAQGAGITWLAGVKRVAALADRKANVVRRGNVNPALALTPDARDAVIIVDPASN